MNQVQESISEHIFIFPFSWQVKNRYQKDFISSHQQIKTKGFEQLRHWEIHYSTIEDDQDYNEFVYFYKPIRSALYTFKDEPLIVKNYYHKYLDKQGCFKICVNSKVYELGIISIRLKLYKTGIGILSFQLRNDQYKEVEELEAINSFSKCIYPPVLPLSKAREEFFPDWISIRLNELLNIEEHFSRNYYKENLNISPLIMCVLGAPFKSKSKDYNQTGILIEPILGNQMFCCCIYQNESLMHELWNEQEGFEAIERLMTLNKPMSYQEGDDQRGVSYYLKNECNIYGISRFMLLCVTRKRAESTLYNQLVTLVLMQRATLLNLSTEIASISTLPKYELADAIGMVYEIYIQFINQLYFKEVTEEWEGSRIYEALSKSFNIEEELSQLNFEVDEVHEYATLIEQTASNVKVQFLTIIGAALVLPSFVTGFFGMNILKEEALHWWNNRQVGLWLNSYVLLPTLVVIALCTWTKRRRTKYLVMKLLWITLIILSGSLVIRYGSGL